MRYTEHSKPIIHVQSSRDSGVEWTEEQHEEYCRQVQMAISLSYSQYAVTCEPSDVYQTKVEVSNPGITFEDEEGIAEECERICQNVWDAGDFWD